MENFKQKLTEKYLAHFDSLLEKVADIEYNKPDFPITQKKHIDIIIKYTDKITQKQEADLMDLYSKSVFSVNPHDSYSENQILDTTDDLLNHQQILFSKGFLSCYESLKKNAGHLYSEDAIKKSLVVNTASRLEMARDEFEKWTENVSEVKTEKSYDSEVVANA